jgi:hypothetical protein
MLHGASSRRSDALHPTVIPDDVDCPEDASSGVGYWLVRTSPNYSGLLGSGYGSGVRRAKDSPYELVRYAQPRLHALRNLRSNWDGEGGEAATTDAIIAMDEILKKVADRRTVFPYLSPDGEGGVLAEWHAKEQKIEIEVDAVGEANFYATDQAGKTVLEDGVNPTTEWKLRRLLLDLSARVDRENPTWRDLFAR